MTTTVERWRYKHLSDLGFSLTELMVVLVIIGVLVLLALPKLLPIVTKAKTTEAKQYQSRKNPGTRNLLHHQRAFT